MSEIEKKLVIIGDGACGKTCLLSKSWHGTFPQESISIVFDNHVKKLEVDGKKVALAVWDTVGREGYERLRPMSYKGADIFLIVYAVDLPDSLHNVEDKWLQEVKKFCPGVPYILVACKKDLRDDPATIGELKTGNMTPVSKEYGRKISQKIGAFDFVECSALNDTHQDILAVFEAAVRAATAPVKDDKPKNCKLM